MSNLITPVSIENLPSVASAGMLMALNISVWEARKKDKGTEEEIMVMKGAASRRATSVHKHLFSECPALDAIKALRGEMRLWFNRATAEWQSPFRWGSTKSYFEIMQDFNNFHNRMMNQLVPIFVSVYSVELSKQAFQLGSMFNRNDYPDVSEIAQKFKCDLIVAPVPLSGHFTVDLQHEAMVELQERCTRNTQDGVMNAMGDAWQRVKDQVEHIKERMDAVIEHDPDAVEEIKKFKDDGVTLESVEIKKKRRPKLHDSMLDHGMELCALLRDLNITNDPKLEEARQMLESALIHVDMDSLKKVSAVQTSVRSKMQDILDKFAF